MLSDLFPLLSDPTPCVCSINSIHKLSSLARLTFSCPLKCLLIIHYAVPPGKCLDYHYHCHHQPPHHLILSLPSPFSPHPFTSISIQVKPIKFHLFHETSLTTSVYWLLLSLYFWSFYFRLLKFSLLQGNHFLCHFLS